MAIDLGKLVELWPCDEGSGSVAHGALLGTVMTLRRISPWDFSGTGGNPSGSEVDAGTGWDVEYVDGQPALQSGKTIFNGNGVATLPTPLALAVNGDGISLVVRLTTDWVKQDGPPFQGLGGGVTDVLGASGRYSALPTVGSGVGIENIVLSTRSGVLKQYGPGTDLPFTGAIISLPIYVPVIVVLTIKRMADPLSLATAGGPTGSNCLANVYYDGVLKMSMGVVAAGVTLNRVSFGSLGEGSFGAIKQAMVFSYAIPQDDIPDTPEDIDAIEEETTGEMAGPGTSNPWLNADGSLRLRWPWPHGIARAGTVIASEGSGGRQTRMVHEREPRRYSITWNNVEAGVLAIVLEGLEVTKGGAASTRWRHPIDDTPGTVVSAPRWRVLNVVEPERADGGVLGTIAIEIEEVS